MKHKYFVKKISRLTAKKLLDEYHYLHLEGGSFRSGINFGLFDRNTLLLIGVCVFHTNSAKEIVKGCFGIQSYKLDGFYELGRLCLNPHFFEKNITSYFLGASIRQLRKLTNITALLTYADTGKHVGYIYQACNFKYYGLTSPKKDFFYNDKNGVEVKLQRGKCKHLDGEWRDKTQKHRYLIIYDNNLKTLWEQQPYPKGEQLAEFNNKITDQPKQIFMPKEAAQQTLF